MRVRPKRKAQCATAEAPIRRNSDTHGLCASVVAFLFALVFMFIPVFWIVFVATVLFRCLF